MEAGIHVFFLNYKNMDALLNTDLYKFLSSNSFDSANEIEILDLYHRFASATTEFCDKSNDYKLLFRTLSYTHEHLDLLFHKHSTKNKHILHKYIRAAIHLIESEQKLLNNRLTYPTLFQQPTQIDIPDLYWNSKFSKRDLVELLTSVEHLGPILNAVGKLVSFSVLVTFAEKTLHISLPNAYKIREEVLSRKTKSADFLKRLLDALIEKTEK